MSQHRAHGLMVHEVHAPPMEQSGAPLQVRTQFPPVQLMILQLVEPWQVIMQSPPGQLAREQLPPVQSWIQSPLPVQSVEQLALVQV